MKSRVTMPKNNDLTTEIMYFCDNLFDTGMIRFGQFKLKLHDKFPNAPLSPIYVDLRLLRSYPKLLDYAANSIIQMISLRSISFDLIADVPTAGTPLAVAVSLKMSKPLISPRIDLKTHGIRRKIDGIYSEGQNALLIDDLITNAASKMEVISVLDKFRIQVQNIAVVLDREQGGKDQLKSHGIELHSILSLKSILKYYRETKRISRETFENTIKYLSTNR